MGKPSQQSGSDARERTLRTAYDLFCRFGVNTVGVDRIIAEAGVAKMTLYRHFPSKDELVLAALDRREELWTRGWLEQEVDRRGRTPVERLLAIFDLLDEWFRRDDYEGCLFVNSLLEAHDSTSTIGAASTRSLTRIREFLRGLAEEAGLRDPDEFAGRWQLLMLGCIVAAAAGDLSAAQRARSAGSILLEREGLPPTP